MRQTAKQKAAYFLLCIRIKALAAKYVEGRDEQDKLADEILELIEDCSTE
jgi:hypothetical protein